MKIKNLLFNILLLSIFALSFYYAAFEGIEFKNNVWRIRHHSELLVVQEAPFVPALKIVTFFSALFNILLLAIFFKNIIGKKTIFFSGGKYLAIFLYISFIMAVYSTTNYPLILLKTLLAAISTFFISFCFIGVLKNVLLKISELKFIRIISIISINIIVLTILLEIGIIILSCFIKTPLLVKDNAHSSNVISTYQKKYRTGTIRMGFPLNSHGFYDREVTQEKNDNSFRVLALADSFGMGIVPYKNNFLTLLENNTAKEQELKNIDVINTGIPRIGTNEYYVLFKKYFKKYHCDHVLLCLFTGNDIESFEKFKTAKRFFYPEYWYTYVVAKRLYAIFKEGSKTGKKLSNIAKIQDESFGHLISPEDEKPTFSEQLFLKIERRRVDVCNTELNETRKAYNDTFKNILKIQKECAGKLTVFLIPDEFQVNSELWDKIMSNFDLDKTKYDKDYPSKRLKEFCRDNNIDFIDPIEELRMHEENINRTYHLRDTHWNAFGNKIAAKVIAENFKIPK
jgi:hypothetical protein